MTFIVVGLNHRTAPLAIRERISIDREQLGLALNQLGQHIDQGVVLSTCNRTEVYCQGSSGDDLGATVRHFLSAYSGLDGESLEPHLYEHQDEDCANHLFRVASGLDSMVIGERQILGQVRVSYNAAIAHGKVCPILSQMFLQAIETGRRIQRETNIGGHLPSVSQAGVMLAREILGDLSQQKALVVGAGHAARLSAQALVNTGLKNIAVTNRTHSRAVEVSHKLGGVAVPFDRLGEHIRDADVVISSTGSHGFVLDRPLVQHAMSTRQSRPLVIIDIAVPRDVDPQVGDLENVTLRDIDGLQPEPAASPPSEELERELLWAKREAEQDRNKFMIWLKSQESVPVIAAIREQAESIRSSEVAKTLRRLKGEWPPETAEYLDALSSAIVKKLLHNPTIYLKDRSDLASRQFASRMFNIGQVDEEGVV